MTVLPQFPNTDLATLMMLYRWVFSLEWVNVGALEVEGENAKMDWMVTMRKRMKVFEIMIFEIEFLNFECDDCVIDVIDISMCNSV